MGHSYTNILLHVVFGTKGRLARIEAGWRQRLYEYMAGVAKTEFGHALKIGGTGDHVHALLSMNNDVSISDAMRKWKCLSSGWVHETFSDASAFAWQRGYAAFSVSRSNASGVIRYIDGQEAHHRKQTFQEEFRAFLERHGVRYDPGIILA